jgi:hypothetical protein
MTYTNRRHSYSARRIRRYTYPNEADPGYFMGKLLDGITAIVTGMGTVTLILYFLTF